MGVIKTIGLACVMALAAAHLPGAFDPMAPNGGAHSGAITLSLGTCGAAPQSCLTSVDDAESLKTFVLYRLSQVKAELAAEKLAKS